MPMLTTNRTGSTELMIQDAVSAPTVSPTVVTQLASNDAISPLMAARAASSAVVNQPSVLVPDKQKSNLVFMAVVAVAIYFIMRKK